MIQSEQKAPEVKDLQGIGTQPKDNENLREKQTDTLDFARVGDRYYQRVFNPNTQTNTYIPRDRTELKADGIVLQQVPKFSMFTNLPSHTEYQRKVLGTFNLYEELNYKPETGRYETTLGLLQHIFGSQLHLALDYLTILWRHPTQMLPIIVLLSREQGTGKSSFMRWLRMLFGANVAILNVSQYCQQFNAVYAGKLLICIDEAALSEEFLKERLKQDSTQTEINLRKMHTEYQTLPFYGKFIVASNKELDFCKLEDEDVRFWVIKVRRFDKYDPDFAAKLGKEVPAFAAFLNSREITTPNSSRMWFDPKQIETEALRVVRKNSISDCAKDVAEFIADKLSPTAVSSYTATATEIFEAIGRKYALKDISRAIREELGYENKCMRYKDAHGNEKVGRAFYFDSDPLIIDDGSAF